MEEVTGGSPWHSPPRPVEPRSSRAVAALWAQMKDMGLLLALRVPVRHCPGLGAQRRGARLRGRARSAFSPEAPAVHPLAPAPHCLWPTGLPFVRICHHPCSVTIGQPDLFHFAPQLFLCCVLVSVTSV